MGVVLFCHPRVGMAKLPGDDAHRNALHGECRADTCIDASSEYRQPDSTAPRTRLRNAGSHALTSRTHSASER